MADETVFTTREEAVSALHAIAAERTVLAQATNYGKRGPALMVADFHTLDDMAKSLAELILEQFGIWNPNHPTCVHCRYVSVFGGPGHEASLSCRSGKRNHCSCAACW